MARWQLVASYDGDIIQEFGLFVGVEAARQWAVGRLIAAFDIGCGQDAEFPEAVGETDGVSLKIIEPNFLEVRAANLLQATRMLSRRFVKQPDFDHSDERARLLLCDALLSQALEDAGWSVSGPVIAPPPAGS